MLRAGVDLVVQTEPPKEPEIYIHRSGRTGRAGSTGVCITLCSRKHEPKAQYIEKVPLSSLSLAQSIRPACMHSCALSNSTSEHQMLLLYEHRLLGWLYEAALYIAVDCHYALLRCFL
jgi:superfamily II DNA/RNA helicase